MALLATTRLSRRCAQTLSRPAAESLGLSASASVAMTLSTPSSAGVRRVHSLVLARRWLGEWPHGAARSVRAVSSTRVAGNKYSIVNDEIQARAVSVVGDDGALRTNVPLRRAIEEARTRGVDLVQVSQNDGQTVCRMFDAKKRAFSLKKAVKPQKPKQDKEVNFTPKIAIHDLQFKVNQVKKFLGKGHKVKVTVKFGNQLHLKETALEQLETITEAIGADVGTADAAPRLQFGGVYVFFAPAK